MSNVLSHEQRQQVLALERLGWTLRRIEQATGVRRETAGAYLKAAGLVVRRFVRRLRGRRPVEARVVITTAPGEEEVGGTPARVGAHGILASE